MYLSDSDIDHDTTHVVAMVNMSTQTGLRRNISKTIASVLSGFQTREKFYCFLLFSSVWKPDETRGTRFLKLLLQQRKLFIYLFQFNSIKGNIF